MQLNMGFEVRRIVGNPSTCFFQARERKQVQVVTCYHRTFLNILSLSKYCANLIDIMSAVGTGQRASVRPVLS